ncbi:hypothetical protein M569_02261, partial [Genlisea aurea]
MADSAVDCVSAQAGDPKSEGDQAAVDSDPDFFCCLLQPVIHGSDPYYNGIRRLLLFRKAEAGVRRRQDWRCNGKGYVAYRNYINRPRDGESCPSPSVSNTTLGHSGRWISSRTPLSQFSHADKWSISGGMLSAGKSHSRSPSFSSNTSDIEFPHKKSEPAYSFVGMHCIFDQCKAMVTVVKFGHMSSDLLAFGASDGSLTVCTVSSSSVLKQLTGHTKDIADFDFSANNQYIASSSIDKTVRLWDISKGICMRVIYGVFSQLCIRFHPVNNNFLSVGNSNREMLVYNFSTGRAINKLKSFDSEVTAMDHDHTGQLIFCGDSQGSVYTVTMNSRTGALARAHRRRIGGKIKSPVTTVQYRTFSLLAGGPVLLTFCRDGSLSFFSVSPEVQGYLTLGCSLKLAPRLNSIHASFCPLLSLEKGEFI